MLDEKARMVGCGWWRWLDYHPWWFEYVTLLALGEDLRPFLRLTAIMADVLAWQVPSVEALKWAMVGR